MQQLNLFPPPPPGTAVTTTLLTSAASSKHNNKTGTVVEAPSADMVRPGLAFVQLDGDVKPTAAQAEQGKTHISRHPGDGGGA